MFDMEANRIAYLTYIATMANVGINTEILQINKLILQSNEKRNQELMELLKEIKNDFKEHIR